MALTKKVWYECSEVCFLLLYSEYISEPVLHLLYLEYRSWSCMCVCVCVVNEYWKLTLPQSMRKAPSLLSLSADRWSRGGWGTTVSFKWSAPCRCHTKGATALFVCIFIFIYIYLFIPVRTNVTYIIIQHENLTFENKISKRQKKKKSLYQLTVITDTPKQSNFSSVLHPDTFNSLLSDSTDSWSIITSGLDRLLPGQTCCPAGTIQDEPFASAAAAAASWTHTWRRHARPVVCWCLSATLSGKKYKHFL